MPPQSNQFSPIQASPSAQAAHLKDLQHQLSVKTLAMQTLQHDHDALIQKLERQRIKCATLEKKFAVSDSEICALSNDKDRLELHVEILEKQIEKLNADRDEARKASAASSAQYLMIVEMAGRLQGKALSNGDASSASSSSSGVVAEDGKPWGKEREGLLKRIADLEATVVVGGGAFMRYSEQGILEEAAKAQQEVRKLRERNAILEKGLVAAKQAALTLAVHGNNVGVVLNKALES
jgi:predicted nuclease with TOPRIM domain